MLMHKRGASTVDDQQQCGRVEKNSLAIETYYCSSDVTPCGNGHRRPACSLSINDTQQSVAET
jgi:hypothetical protein